MLESYQNEIKRKRRASRIFWLIVFLFAGFLYFFFQGYYPSIHFSLESITGSGNSQSPSRDIIRSFGIVNVSVEPSLANILLSNTPYSNDEKRMVPYGTYALDISHIGYLPYKSTFLIEKETPYYIDLLSLLPVVRYGKYTDKISHIAKISSNRWLAHTSSGMISLDENFTLLSQVSPRVYTYIGDTYFLSGSSVVSYKEERQDWEIKSWSGSSEFIKKCAQSIEIKHGNLWCKKTGGVLTQKGQSFTGVLSLGDGYIEKMGLLLTGTDYKERVYFGTGVNPENSLFINKDGHWYTPKNGDIIPLGGANKKENPILKTPLDQIDFMSWVDGDLYILGKKGEKKYLYIYNSERKKFLEPREFPDIPTREVRIIKKNNNLFIKTQTALLFLYHNSMNIDWLIEGEILAYSEESALYKKDGVLWKATWKSLE